MQADTGSPTCPTFDEIFQCATDSWPHPWQRALAQSAPPGDEAEAGRESDGDTVLPWEEPGGPRHRLIRIPTGMGKTAGTVLVWLWHRLSRGDARWPRRLVFCLPMRVLVEQVVEEVRTWLRRLDLLWDGMTSHCGRVGVHLLMGGADSGDWHLYPEEASILIGTQDMLLSRALNRGYGSPRARWPMELGLLSQDCLWILDEVQLMDVGLATFAQLGQFRDLTSSPALPRCCCWWMSATLQPDWLKSPDTTALLSALGEPLAVPSSDQRGSPWEVAKSLELQTVHSSDELARLVLESHRRLEAGDYGRISLVVVNTVDRAVDVHARLRELCRFWHSPSSDSDADLARHSDPPELHLIHSRFRPHERARWREQFLSRSTCSPDANRILIATQVVEAGVDISAGCLITELAPWPSLVQRFGRAARYGGSARVVVVDLAHEDDNASAPYRLEHLERAKRLACDPLQISGVSLTALEAFELSLTDEQRAELYPYSPEHLLLRHEWEALFDTTPDLTGADLDISRFIRSGDERDVHVFWLPIPPKEEPASEIQPAREALCPVPFKKARDWLCGIEAGERRATRLLSSKRAWVWDWLEGRWRTLQRKDLYPGQVVLVSSDSGGYLSETGWTPGAGAEVRAVAVASLSSGELADAHQDGEDLSIHPWKTIATHGGEVARIASEIAADLGLPTELREALALAARWHDLGKAHPAFQGSIRSERRPDRQDLAKAPKPAWSREDRYRDAESGERRPGFRHELASALALFSVLERHAPQHTALRGPWQDMLDELAQGISSPPEETGQVVAPPTAVEQSVIDLPASAFDLVAYLVASHHGKVRVGLHAGPGDQDYRAEDKRGLPIRGVREGDILPETTLDPAAPPLPALALTLEPAAVGLSMRTGASWAERVDGLLQRFGPGGLAFLEACLRAADIRASRLDTPDPLLTSEVPS